MHPDRLREALRILDECARVPDDPKAQTVARWVRESLQPDGDADRQRAAVLALRRAIAGALVPGSGQAH
jgi:hypothetical protein